MWNFGGRKCNTYLRPKEDSQIKRTYGFHRICEYPYNAAENFSHMRKNPLIPNICILKNETSTFTTIKWPHVRKLKFNLHICGHFIVAYATNF